MRKIFIASAIIAMVIAFGSCEKIDFPWLHHSNDGLEKADARIAHDWYKLELRILLERNSAMRGVYFGYIGIGLYESVRNGIEHAASFAGKLYQMPVMPAKENFKSYNWLVSANAAMAAMLRSFNSGLTTANNASIDSLENAYNQLLRPLATNEIFSRSQAYGKSVATSIYNWSLTDNYNPSNVGYIPPVFPGAWVPTPPAFAKAANPFVSSARPFLPENASAVAPSFPAVYSEDPASDFYKIVKNVYDVSKTLTTEQKNIALFWVDLGNGLGVTTDGHNISVIVQALEQNKASLAVSAEAYAKAGIADREAFIVCFRSKYKYNLVRPVTYIQKFIDSAWLPFIPTPAHPEYPAAHAFVTGTVMEAVTKVLGNHITVTDHTYDFRGWTSRTYNSLVAVGQEAGISRLYGGIHYLPSINEGLSLAHDLGKKIGSIQLIGD